MDIKAFPGRSAVDKGMWGGHESGSGEGINREASVVNKLST